MAFTESDYSRALCYLGMIATQANYDCIKKYMDRVSLISISIELENKIKNILDCLDEVNNQIKSLTATITITVNGVTSVNSNIEATVELINSLRIQYDYLVNQLSTLIGLPIASNPLHVSNVRIEG